jgi:hypothetical protein
MWGICLDTSLCDGKLLDRVVEYQPQENSAVILQPVSGIETDMQQIRPLEQPPKYRYGDAVFPADHPERKGVIRDMVWHFKARAVMYFIESNGRKISKRYDEDDLIPAG